MFVVLSHVATEASYLPFSRGLLSDGGGTIFAATSAAKAFYQRSVFHECWYVVRCN